MTSRVWQPIWRSRTRGNAQFRWGPGIVVILFTWLGPALITALVGGIIGSLLPQTEILASVRIFGVLSPVFGVVLVPIGVATFALAARFGLAGLAIALLAGLLAGLGLAALLAVLDDVAALASLVIVSALHAFVLWMSVRLFLADMLIEPLEDDIVRHF